MGGYGSGRPRIRAYLTGRLRLPLSAFTPQALHPRATSTGSFGWANGSSIGFEKTAACLVLRYSVNDENIEQRIDLLYLPRHFGGVLPVAECPTCCRRTRVFYYARRRFVCRRCTGAVYASKGYSATICAQVRFQRLRERIRPGTWDAELDYFPRRPKRMRRTTYVRIKGEAFTALDRYHAGLDVGLWRLLRRIAPDKLAALLK